MHGALTMSRAVLCKGVAAFRNDLIEGRVFCVPFGLLWVHSAARAFNISNPGGCGRGGCGCSVRRMRMLRRWRRRLWWGVVGS